MEIIHGNEETFQNDIQDELVLVDFFATWCGPCKMLSPVLENLANSRSNVKIVKVDVDECENLARTYGVMSVPTLILFKNGKECSKKIGYLNEEALNEFIEEHR